MDMQERLYKKYPKIFRQKDLSMQQTCMCWGIECGEGWENLLDALCSSIQYHIDNSRSNRARYLINLRAVKRALKNGTLNELANNVFRYDSDRKEKFLNDPLNFYDPIEVIPQLEATQVKEKFGTLRFYSMGGDEYCFGAISMAEYMSGITCEICGDKGRIVGGGWVKCRCEKHENQ
jgi:hypothetical protein